MRRSLAENSADCSLLFSSYNSGVTVDPIDVNDDKFAKDTTHDALPEATSYSRKIRANDASDVQSLKKVKTPKLYIF
jgi:hypothetical protein